MPDRSRHGALHLRGLRLALAGCATLLLTLVAPAASAASYVTISGSGDSWSQVALDAWRVDVAANGLTVNYNSDGATAGRQDFIQGLSDFSVSPIPFQTHPQDGSPPEISPRPYAYMPIVAGGTAFMYHIDVGGHLITNLRLSGQTITKIFTGVITNWDDPEITKEYGAQLPNLPITPVIRSDGSGTSAELSEYMATEYPSLWQPFCARYAHVSGSCGMLSFYPNFPGSKAQTGSNGVADYVASSYANGSICYVEYAYAADLNFPSVRLLNAAGYFTLPTASNVAVALTRAIINPDLTQNLTNVYTNPDPRTYPLSSYDYFIIPTTTAAPFNTEKGATLSTFADFFLCQGQQQAPQLYYSPLPLNLVEDAFAQVRRIPGNVGTPPLSSCHNPTFSGGVNTLLKYGPYPTRCDKLGSPLNCTTGGSGGGGSGGRSGGSTGAVSGGSGSTPAGGHGAGTSGLSAATGRAGGRAARTVLVNPVTGQTTTAVAGTTDPAVALAGEPTVGTGGPTAANPVYFALVAAEVVAVVVAPPILVAWLRRRKAGRA